MKRILKTVGRTLAGSIGAVLFILLVLFGTWYLRPNRAEVDPDVVVESWDIANDGRHNSNTDMIEQNRLMEAIQWNGY